MLSLAQTLTCIAREREDRIARAHERHWARIDGHRLAKRLARTKREDHWLIWVGRPFTREQLAISYFRAIAKPAPHNPSDIPL